VRVDAIAAPHAFFCCCVRRTFGRVDAAGRQRLQHACRSASLLCCAYYLLPTAFCVLYHLHALLRLLPLATLRHCQPGGVATRAAAGDTDDETPTWRGRHRGTRRAVVERFRGIAGGEGAGEERVVRWARSNQKTQQAVGGLTIAGGYCQEDGAGGRAYLARPQSGTIAVSGADRGGSILRRWLRAGAFSTNAC